MNPTPAVAKATSTRRAAWPLRRSLAACLMALALPAALTTPVNAIGADQDPGRAAWSEVLRSASLPKGAESSEATQHALAGLQAAGRSELAAASRGLNQALQLDPANAALHFFNGFVYHLQARAGDAEKAGLAVEGYRQALRLDPAHWVAHEFLGLALMEQKNFAGAQRALAEALLLRPDDARLQQRLLVASYMAGDATTACAMADQLDAAASTDRVLLRGAVSVYAACARFDRAQVALQTLRPRDAEAAGEAQRRLDQWQAFHRQRPAKASLLQTQYSPGGYGSSGGYGAPGASPYPQMPQTQFPGSGTPGMSGYGGSPGYGSYPGSSSSFGMPGSAPQNPVGEGRMVLLDVVMLRTEDSISTAKGVNLLNALSMQFGSSTQAAFSRATTVNTPDLSGTGNGASTLLTRAVTVPALTYTLNLANANSNLNEVLARPTLAAVEGLRSEFFSGTSLNAAVVSASTSAYGGSVQLEKRYGVKLSVQPQFMPNGLIRLTIDASRTFLKPPNANIAFTYKLEISEILANANVVMRMGDTLVLGGLSEKESTTDRDGVPGLQDLPGLQYLFSRQSRTDFQRSVLILITPRPTAYTWRPDDPNAPRVDASKPGEAGDNSMEVLRARYGDWFKPYPNLAAVFHHLNDTELYREFRTADVTLERWERMDSTAERLRQALKFLHY